MTRATPSIAKTSTIAACAIAAATVTATPALACGPSGHEATVLAGIATMALGLFALTQWGAVRLLHNAFAYGWSNMARVFAGIIATFIIGQGLVLSFVLLADVPALGVPFVALEMFAVVKAFAAISTGITARRVGSIA